MRREAEEMKEIMLQEMRRRPGSNYLDDQEEKERARRIVEYQERMFQRSQSNDKLFEVQEQLLKIFGKLKVKCVKYIKFKTPLAELKAETSLGLFSLCSRICT